MPDICVNAPTFRKSTSGATSMSVFLWHIKVTKQTYLKINTLKTNEFIEIQLQQRHVMYFGGVTLAKGQKWVHSLLPDGNVEIGLS